MIYKKPLIIIVILYGILIPLTLSAIINPSPNETDITPLLPGNSNLDLTILFLLIIPLSAILGSLLGYFLAPLFLHIHKKTVGRSFSYGIQERSSPKEFKRFFYTTAGLERFIQHQAFIGAQPYIWYVIFLQDPFFLPVRRIYIEFMKIIHLFLQLHGEIPVSHECPVTGKSRDHPAGQTGTHDRIIVSGILIQPPESFPECMFRVVEPVQWR